MTSIVVLNTQMYNIKLEFLQLISESDAQRHMIEYGFERKFDDLKYFELRFFFHIP